MEYEGINFEHCQRDDIDYVGREYYSLIWKIRDLPRICVDCGTHGGEAGKMLMNKVSDLEAAIENAATLAEKEKLEFLKKMIQKGYDPNEDVLRPFSETFKGAKMWWKNEPKTT